MLNILIDTSNKKCCLALAKNQHIFKTKILTNHNNLTDIIVEHLSKLLISAQLEPNNIHNVYLVNGPGSFTGVRVGCMLAKALATIYKLKIYVIDSLYWQLLTPSGISLLDARGNQVYVSIYKNHKQLLKPHLMPLTKANQLIQKYHLPVYKFYQQVKVRTNFYFHYKEFKLTSPTQLVPFYIKPPV